MEESNRTVAGRYSGKQVDVSAERTLLNELLEIGRRELELLQAGDVNEAETLSRDRCSMAEKVLSSLNTEMARALEAELLAVDELQQALTAEASILREQVKAELISIRQQAKRLSGYKSGAGFASASHSPSRFVSKSG